MVTDTWEMLPSLSPAQRLEVLHLINETESSIGREALEETRRRAVVHGWPAEHWLGRNGSQLVSYACVQRGDNLTVEMCGGGVDEDLLECLLLRNDELYWWTRHNSDPHHNTVRTLLLLSRQLPAPGVAIPQGLELRTFNPDVDACAWLEQNNAAFANHPEQGAWRLEDLEARLAEPWFDPSGFLLLCNGTEIAASCWTKVHELSAERFGEIYVLSVNPSYQGQGLGRVMLSAGLSALRHKGVSRVELFVDEDNISALALYQSLGFTLQRKDLLLHFSN